jgi:hypothetical protein
VSEIFTAETRTFRQPEAVIVFMKSYIWTVCCEAGLTDSSVVR